MKKRLLASFLLLVAVLLGLIFSGWATYLWHGWRLSAVELPDNALDLSRYRAEIQRKPIEGVEDDLSALSWNAESGTLWAVLNGQPLMVELSTEGELLRQVRIDGASDLEGISHVSGERFVLAEERNQRLLLLDLPADAETVAVSQLPALSIGLDQGSKNNKGFEGTSWDQAAQRLLVVKERDPMRVLSVGGFVEQRQDQPLQLVIDEVKASDSPRLFMRDLSSLARVPANGHLLLLSDESKMLVEYAADGQPLSLMGLRFATSGLRRSIPQAEGVAVDEQGRIFIVSEPNLFYRFVPQDE